LGFRKEKFNGKMFPGQAELLEAIQSQWQEIDCDQLISMLREWMDRLPKVIGTEGECHHF